MARGRCPWVTILLSVFAIGVFGFGSALENVLLYDRNSIASGEIWRLWTGHFVHADGFHLMWNLIAFITMAGHFEGMPGGGGKRLAILLGASAMLIGVGLYAMLPQWLTYCGLSGICYAPLIAVLIALSQKTKSLVFPILTGIVALKVLVEWDRGGGLFDLFGTIPTATEAHLIGALVGLVGAVTWHPFCATDSVT
ncbi:MAG: rhombosortase [Pseudomonadota bacterium]